MQRRLRPIAVLFMLLIMTFQTVSAATQRGLEVRVKSISGATQTIPLYSGYYALVIGCSDYDSGWPRLSNPVKDAVEVADVLRKKGWAVNTLLNPKSREMSQTLSRLIGGPGKDPSKAVLIWFSGHGHTLKKADGRNMGYIVPVDAPDPNEDFSGFIERAVDMQRIEDISMMMQSKHVLMVFDSCFSGTIFRQRSGPPPPFIEEKVAQPVRQYITAGNEDEKVPDESVFKTVFIQGIVKGYADLNRDNYVTGEELGRHLQEEVVNYSEKRQHPQYGKINNEKMDKGDFIFALPELDPDNLVAGQPWDEPISGMAFVWVPRGCFQMGCVSGANECQSDERPVHEACLDGFWMGRHEVTNAQFRQFKPEHDSGQFQGQSLNNDDQPVVAVSWNDAREFAEWLGRQNNSHYRFLLPTEAQWEYAARAGTKTARFWGERSTDACRYANVYDEFALTENPRSWSSHNCNDGFAVAAPVGSFKANRFGLHDMLGNACEWCRDVYDKEAYAAHAKANPLQSGGGNYRVHRGGSWGVRPGYVRSADRFCAAPDLKQSLLGFRLVRMP